MKEILEKLGLIEKEVDKTKPFVEIKKAILTIYAPHAKKPVLWHGDLNQTGMLLFSVEKKATNHNLCIGSGKDQEIIASFKEEKNALDMYQRVAVSLSGFKGSGSSDESEESGGFFKSFIIFLAFFAILYWVMTAFFVDDKPQYTMSKKDIRETLRIYEQTMSDDEQKSNGIKTPKDNAKLSKEEIEDGVALPLDQLLK